MRNAERGMRNGRARVDSAFRIPHSALASVLNVALTGNIAAGKSTVVDLWRRWGATIIDADELTRQAQAPGGTVLAAIAQRFGADVLAADGALDRAALRGKVMGDQAALDALNAIVHPAVRGRPARTLLLVAPRSDAKHPALSAIGARYGDAGLAVHRVADSRSALEKALQRPDERPDAIVATHPAASAAEQAWTRAGRPGVLAYLSDDPDPVAVRLDLRPWGYERLRLMEPGAAGLAPRPDLFPSANPLG